MLNRENADNADQVQRDTQRRERELDTFQAQLRVGTVYHCPTPGCGGMAKVEQYEDEEQVTCQRCGMVAIEGCIIVPGKRG